MTTDDKSSRLDDLNTTLMGVENDLMGRALERSRKEVEHAYDFINDAAEQGIIDIECSDCGEVPDESTSSEEGGEEAGDE